MNKNTNDNVSVAQAKVSNVTVGVGGNINNLLNSLAYELEVEEVGSDLVLA